MGSEEVEAARAAQLRYVSDSRPGIRRRAAGSGFVYLETEGRPVEEEVVLARIKSLAIPPAWTEVWICRLSHGHLQASGRDARGRKQYRYHARWRKVRDECKFDRMLRWRSLPPAQIGPATSWHCCATWRRPRISRARYARTKRLQLLVRYQVSSSSGTNTSSMLKRRFVNPCSWW
jgi:hypothetical protein